MDSSQLKEGIKHITKNLNENLKDKTKEEENHLKNTLLEIDVTDMENLNIINLGSKSENNQKSENKQESTKNEKPDEKEKTEKSTEKPEETTESPSKSETKENPPSVNSGQLQAVPTINFQDDSANIKNKGFMKGNKKRIKNVKCGLCKPNYIYSTKSNKCTKIADPGCLVENSISDGKFSHITCLVCVPGFFHSVEGKCVENIISRVYLVSFLGMIWMIVLILNPY